MLFQALSTMEEFHNLDRDIEGSAKRWKKFSESECPEKEKFPQEWKNKTSLQRLCMMRALRPDRMTYAVRSDVNPSFSITPQCFQTCFPRSVWICVFAQLHSYKTFTSLTEKIVMKTKCESTPRVKSKGLNKRVRWWFDEALMDSVHLVRLIQISKNHLFMNQISVESVLESSDSLING